LPHVSLCQQEEYLAESFNMFLDHSLQLLRKHRQLFLPYNRVAMCRLEYLLRYTDSLNDLFVIITISALRLSRVVERSKMIRPLPCSVCSTVVCKGRRDVRRTQSLT
jgi:hypothetical protein